MSAKHIWTTGAIGASVVSLFSLLSIAPRMEDDLRNAVTLSLVEAGVNNDFETLVDGQDVNLRLKSGVSNAQTVLKTASYALTTVTIPNRANLPAGNWITGPIAAVKISSEVKTRSNSVSHNPASIDDQSVSSQSGESLSSVSSVLMIEKPAVSSEASPKIDAKTIAKARSCEQKVSKKLKDKSLGFRFSSYELNTRGRKLVSEVSQVLATCPGSVKVIVVGHTDAIGDAKTNQLISLARAESVANALTEDGISAERIRYEGRGEDEPVANNQTRRGRLKNRRVVFKIVAQ